MNHLELAGADISSTVEEPPRMAAMSTPVPIRSVTA